MDVGTENLPILQDFVPYRGRCLKSGRRKKVDKVFRSKEEIKAELRVTLVAEEATI